MRWAGGVERRGGRGGAALIGSTVWATGLASGLAAIAKFVCDTVCSRRLHTKRETQERLVEKDFSFFYFLFHERFLFFIFFFMKDFSFFIEKRLRGLNVPLVLKLVVATTFFERKSDFLLLISRVDIILQYLARYMATTSCIEQGIS